MNEKKLRKQLFQLGFFYQIDSFNPVYLDKTGELIAKSEGKLFNWNGNIDMFNFTNENNSLNGRVSMNHYWYSDTKQDNYNENSLPTFIEFIKESNELISSVYQPKNFSRIGLRMQYIAKNNSDTIKNNYKHFFNDKFSAFSKFGKLNTNSIGFEIQGSEYNIKVNITYAKRQTQNDINAPDEGLLFDVDFYKKLDKVELDKIERINNNFLDFVATNYQQVLLSIHNEMGIIHE